MNPSLCHKFLDIPIIPDGLNLIEANKSWYIYYSVRIESHVSEQALNWIR
jgi:hypothetical protein